MTNSLIRKGDTAILGSLPSGTIQSVELALYTLRYTVRLFRGQFLDN